MTSEKVSNEANEEVLCMDKNTGILREIHADEYGFGTEDLTVAVLIKAYLQQVEPESVPELLCRVISPGVRSTRGGTVKKRGLDKKQWITINSLELAVLIDDAKEAAVLFADVWQAQEDETLLKKTIDYMLEVLPVMSGEKYVPSMPVEMAEFITDCWLAVA